MNTKTKAISEGAMMLAIMGVLILLNRQSAGFFELLLFFLSIPIIIYELKYGKRMAMILCVSTMLLSILIATPTSIFYVFVAISTGWVYGYGVLHDWKNQTLLIFTVLCNLVTIYLTTIIFASIFGYNLQEEANTLLQYLPKRNVGGLDIVSFVKEVVIISYVGIAILQALVTHLLANQMLVRFSLKVKQMNSIYDLHFPKYFAFLIVGVVFLYQVSSFISFNKMFQQVLLGVYAICLFTAILNGCITILCYLRMKSKPKGLYYLVMISCFVPLLQNIIAIIGVFDMYEGFKYKMKVGVSHEIHRKN